MKKILFLSAFLFGICFTASAQVSGKIANSTNLYTLTYSLSLNGVSDGDIVGPNTSVFHNYNNGITIPCTWRASVGPSCTLSGTLNVGGPTTVAFNCTLQQTFLTYDVINLGGGQYEVNVELHH